jgi:hypothetical protein
LNLVITSRYLFLCEWICLSVMFMFYSCCILIKLHPSLRIFLCAILFIYNKLCIFIIQESVEENYSSLIKIKFWLKKNSVLLHFLE